MAARPGGRNQRRRNRRRDVRVGAFGGRDRVCSRDVGLCALAYLDELLARAHDQAVVREPVQGPRQRRAYRHVSERADERLLRNAVIDAGTCAP